MSRFPRDSAIELALAELRLQKRDDRLAKKALCLLRQVCRRGKEKAQEILFRGQELRGGRA